MKFVHFSGSSVFCSRAVGALLMTAALLAGRTSHAAINGTLQAQDFGNTNWVGGPVGGWAELDYVPCRVRITGGPGVQTFKVDFEHTRGSAPAIQNLYTFTPSAGVSITSGPTLTANAGTTTYSYTFGVNVATNITREVAFFARLAAGCHAVPGNSMSLGGTPSLGNLGIVKPTLITGNPDLSLTKTGATNANPSQVINYSLSWKVIKPGSDATGVQVSDQVPTAVQIVACSGCEVLGNTMIWDLNNQRAGAQGQLSYSVQVTNSIVNGSTFQNNANITSAHDDTNLVNNASFVVTTITGGCIPPTISSQPTSVTNCTGVSSTFTVVANGSGALKYQWRKTTAAISTATNSSFTIASLAVGDAGNYDVIVSNACGSITSTAAVLTVVAPPTCSVTGASNVCPSATSLVFTNAGTASIPTYSWSIAGSGSIVGSTSNSAVAVNAGASGSFTLTSTITDGASGCSDTCNKIVTVSDTTPPNITQCATNILGTANGSCQAAVPSFTNAVVASDTCSTISISQSPAIGTFVGLGTNTVTISVADLNGNTNTCTASFIVRDLTAPTITCPGTVSVNADAGQCSASSVSLGSPVTSDNCGVANVINDAPVTFPVGSTIVTWTVVDNSGNSNTCTQTVTVIDNQPPTFACPANVITNLSLNACLISNVVLGVPATTNDNCGIATVSNNAPVAFSAGTAAVVWTVTDTHGNSASCTQAVTIVDITPPSITQGPTNQTGNAGVSCTAVVPSFTNGVTAATTCGKTFSLSQTPLAGSTAALGTNTVTVFVVDSAGNTNSATASFIVQDTSAPVVTTCPSDQSAEAVSGGEAPVPDFTGGVSASDNCSSFSVSQSPTAGNSLVGLGTNSVTITVTDDASNSTNCVVNFIVTDTTAPTITSCASNQQAEAVANGQAPVPDFTAGVTASDNGGAPIITQSPLAGTQVGVGPHAITITVADASGNSTNCTATFTVVDTTPPTISACAANSGADADADCSAAVPDFTGSVTASDNGTLTITQSPTAGVLVGIGPHTVTLTVADQSSNSTNCTATFTVTDTTAPTITCPADKTVLAAPGATNAVVNFFDPIVSDNCGVAGTACVPASGSEFPLGTTVVSCTVTDNAGLTASCSFNVIVRAVNAAPVANDDNYATDADTALSVSAPGVLVNDTDAEGDALLAVLANPPAHGTVVLAGDGSFVYTPTAGFTGTDAFEYRASDGIENSNLAIVTITVNAVNHTPIALADSYTTDLNAALSVAAPGVLTNDIDANSDTLTAIQIGFPAHGSVTFNSDGSFLFTPDTGFVGFDSFAYAATDGVSTSAPISIVIAVGLNDNEPIAGNDDYATDEDTALVVAAPGVLANDTDANSDPLTAIVVSGAAHGTIALNADGSFTYTPNDNYNGSDFFIYRSNDGTVNSSDAIVHLTVNSVNDGPEAAGDQAYSTPQDTTLNVDVPGVLGSVIDVDGDPLTALLVGNVSNGALTLNPDGSFTYTPGLGFTGVDSFTFAATDGSLTSTPVTVTIYVDGINDAPVANNDNYATDEDTILDIAAPGLLINDVDIDGDILSATLVSNAVHGTVNVNTDGSFTYTPDANFNGSDSFTYRANDGTVDSGVARVFITVNPVNDAPVVFNSTPSVDEDGSLFVPAPGALTGAFDVDGDMLTAILITNVTNGTLIFNADGSYSYTPTPLFFGTDCFTFAATDGITTSQYATVCIAVGHVNHPPVVQNSTPTVPEDGSLNAPAPGALTNATDVDGDLLTAILVTNVTNGTLNFNFDGSYDYTPNADFNGIDCFTFAATDGIATSQFATVCITITAVNDAPTVQDQTPAVDEDGVLNGNVLTGASDPEGDSLTAILITQALNGTAVISADGSYSYTPNANFNGTDCFTFAATDGVATSAFATVCVTITAVNDAPAAADDSYTTPKNTALSVNAAGVLGNDNDVDGDALSAILASDVSNGSLTLSGNGSFVYTPSTDFVGTDSFTYKANDGALDSGIATVTITVTAVANTAPVANDDAYTMSEDDSLDVFAPGVLGNDSDAENDTLTATLVSNPTHGALTFNSDGSFSYVPDNSFNGTDSFTYKANDGQADSSVATVTISVTGVSGAGDIDLLAGSASFHQSRAAANRDRFQVKGRINPRGANAGLAGATMLVTVNGVDLSAPVTLDATGRATLRQGNVKIRASLNSANGRYSFAISGADVAAGLGLPNTTQTGLTVLNISLVVSNANLDIPVIVGDFETPFTTSAGKLSKGRFNFKKHRILTGVFNSNKTIAKLGKNGGYVLRFKGAIENQNDASINPTGSTRILIGNEVLTVPAGATSATGVRIFRPVPAKHTYRLGTDELMDTGIPLPGNGAATSYRLPMQILIPTGATTNVFESIIELKRPDGTSSKWSR